MARTKIDVSLINPVTSSLNMDGNKITNLANGTVSTDAAAFGQITANGTVNSGTATHLSYYATSTNAVSDASGQTILGTYTFSGSSTYTTPLLISAGTVSAPGLAFSGDTGTGIFQDATGRFIVAAGGTEIFRAVDANGILMSGRIDMVGLYKIIDLAAATAFGDALSYGQSSWSLAAGSLTGVLAMGSNKITGLANGTASTDAMAFGQNHVFQVVTGTSVLNFNTSSTSFQTTNLTATITPTSASSKILIIATGNAQNGSGSSTTMQATIARGGSNILGVQGQVVAEFGTTGSQIIPMGLSYLDSPASTSALTYTVQILSSAGTAVAWGVTNATQSIILMEVQ